MSDDDVQNPARAARNRRKSGLPADQPVMDWLRSAETMMGLSHAQRAEIDRVGAEMFGWTHVTGPEAGLAQPARGPPPGPNARRLLQAQEEERAAAKKLKADRKKAAADGRKFAKKLAAKKAKKAAAKKE